ncbi:MAG: GNAT family N-acetyltransferase [Candidatus Altiarchaeota archaeon]|nr:GNAT family N-acetyltransferase [Candidatus Altiarchaeota archaeon]
MQEDLDALLHKAFSRINWGDHIFIGTGCAEPQYLVRSLIEYVESNPKALIDAEIFQTWPLGSVPYADERFKGNFRHNTFFIGKNVREAVNRGLADYTPVSLSRVPDLFRSGLIPVDVALIQVSPPDRRGRMSLGISVDMAKAAIEKADLVIAQANRNMPRTYGDGLLSADDVDYVIPFDEPLIEYGAPVKKSTAKKIGAHLSRLVSDGETIQAGYGSLINEAVKSLSKKKHLGIHTGLLSDGLVELMKAGAADNSRKTLNKGKTVASFCMGNKGTYDYVNENPEIELRTIDYTNDPLVIARHDNMTAINSALGIDLTGQASEESVGRTFYGGIGGQADYMGGALLSKNGKTILVLESTKDAGKTSRITPFLEEGAGVTLNRGEVHYVVTEYGIAYLHGKNIRERAMELIAIAHPKFRADLIEEAKKNNLIYSDQAYIPGKKGIYPEKLETYRTTYTGMQIKIRPVRISDEPLLKDFFYSVSEDSMYHRFISARKDMPHDRLQDYAVIDYEKEMVLLAVLETDGKEEVIGMGQYNINEDYHTAEIAFLVKDAHQKKGVATELLKHMTYMAKKKGLLGFTAEVLMDNKPMMEIFEEAGYTVGKKLKEGIYEYSLMFKTRK